jgi:uncharacterized membrane protein
MHSERGFHRLVNFSDAVVAIAITLLVLPLVNSAGSIGSTGLGDFLDHNKPKLWAFTLSFAVIGSFWWGLHQAYEGVKSYNGVLVWGMFLWLFSIVFLPFPTELIGSARSGRGIHAIYIGTMLVTAIASLVQQWAIVRWPDLQHDASRGGAVIDHALVLTVLMTIAFVGAVALPSVGLWSLLILGLSRPVEHLLAARRTHRPS